MQTAYQALCRAAMEDPACRGLAQNTTQLPALEQIAQGLAGAKGAALISGFPVVTEKGPVGETDGPSGIAWLARALHALGIPVRVYTGQNSFFQIRAALDFACPEVPLVLLPHRPTADWARQQLLELGATHLVTLERPGPSADGVCYNSRGVSIAHLVADAEPLFDAATALGLETIAVGDGGNELGMGGCRPLVEQYVRFGQKICARQVARHTLVAGVSNWWGWGLAGALSLWAGRDLMPTCRQESDLLETLLKADSADGATARFELTVDDMPLSLHLEILDRMRRAVQSALDTAL